MGERETLTDEEIAEIETYLFEIEAYAPLELETGDEELDESFSEPEFDYTVWVDEAVVEILGDDRFDSLIEAFSEIDGVIEVVQEDDEVFFFKAPKLSAAGLEEALKQAYFEVKRLN